MIRRISFVVAVLAALSTAACSNPTAPTATTAKAPKASADVVADSTASLLPPPAKIIVQGSGT